MSVYVCVRERKLQLRLRLPSGGGVLGDQLHFPRSLAENMSVCVRERVCVCEKESVCVREKVCVRERER